MTIAYGAPQRHVSAAAYRDHVEDTTRALPAHDLHALFVVLLTVHGSLHADELPDRIVRRLARRLVEDGLLPRGASKGEVNALLADLAQRMHWAMDPSSDQPYPESARREVTHELRFPTGQAAAQTFVTDAVALGGRDAWARPGQSRMETGPDGSREPLGPPGTWLVAVAFSELPPDPDFVARQTELSALAERHGGHYDGHSG